MDIKIRMRKTGLTQGEIAAQLGVTRIYVNGIACGRLLVPMIRIEKWAALLNCAPRDSRPDIAALFDRTD